MNERTLEVLNSENIPTPFYAYDTEVIKRNAGQYLEAIGKRGLICYAVKANHNLSVLKLLGELGCGADLVTVGELKRALKAGIPANKIVYSGVGKRRDEIAYALKAGILFFNVESVGELFVMNEVAGELGMKAPFCYRFNPDIDAKVHPYICTGLHENQFGIDKHTLIQSLDHLKDLKNLEFVGISQHIGSQMTQDGPMSDAIERVLILLEEIKKRGLKPKWVNVGGGLGISYNGETVPTIKAWASKIIDRFPDLNTDSENGVRLVFEPGRSIVGDSGYLVSRVQYVKQTSYKRFAIVDTGMTELLRPALYNAVHPIITPGALERSNREQGPWYRYNVVGPICESSDCFAKDLLLPELKAGDYVIFSHAGAYGYSMSSNYNSKMRPAEYFMTDQGLKMIRRAETFEDLIDLEVEFLESETNKSKNNAESLNAEQDPSPITRTQGSEKWQTQDSGASIQP